MTNAIESDRFNAKCLSGKTYEVIELTEEIKQPCAHYTQACTVTHKTFFLSTGESVNKLTDKLYLIIKDQKVISRRKIIIRKPNTADIKTMFDYLKNQALCIAIILSTPEIITIINIVYNTSATELICTSITASASIVFSIYNLIWFFSSLEEKPKPNPIHICAILFMLVFVAAVMWLAILKAIIR